MSELRPGDCPLLIFDGACGTTLQAMHLPHSVWDEIGRASCRERV